MPEQGSLQNEPGAASFWSFGLDPLPSDEQILQGLAENEMLLNQPPSGNVVAEAAQEPGFVDPNPGHPSHFFSSSRPSTPQSLSPHPRYQPMCDMEECRIYYNHLHLMHKRSKDRLYRRCQAEIQYLRRELERLLDHNLQLLADRNNNLF